MAHTPIPSTGGPSWRGAAFVAAASANVRHKRYKAC